MSKTRVALSDEHKSALARGREQGLAVRRYLKALEADRAPKGRKRDPVALRARLEAVEAEIPGAPPLKRLHLVQERLDLRAALEAATPQVDLAALEEGFVAAAATYGERKGITYSAWRALGVPSAVLARAGISRAS